MGLAFVITTANLQLLSERKVLKQVEYAALLDASDVVDAARAEARSIVAQGTQQADDSRRTGYEEGLQQAQAEYAQRLVSQALAVEQQLYALRRAMAQIVVKAVGQFIADVEPQALFESALRRVDSLVRSEPYMAVRVAPGQEDAVRQALDRLRTEANWTMNVSLAADPALQPGACVVQTASGMLEIGMDAQLDAFRRAVEHGGMAASNGAGQ